MTSPKVLVNTEPVVEAFKNFENEMPVKTKISRIQFQIVKGQLLSFLF